MGAFRSPPVNGGSTTSILVNMPGEVSRATAIVRRAMRLRISADECGLMAIGAYPRAGVE